MSEATKRPWRADNWNIYGADEVALASITSSHFRETRDANADLIVRAVNAHDDLLAACKDMRDALNAMGQKTPTYDAIIQKATTP